VVVGDLTDRQYTTSLVEESTGKSPKQIQEYVLVIDHLMTKVPDYNIYVYIYIFNYMYIYNYIYIYTYLSKNQSYLDIQDGPPSQNRVELHRKVGEIYGFSEPTNITMGPHRVIAVLGPPAMAALVPKSTWWFPSEMARL